MQVLEKYAKRLTPVGVAFAIVAALTAPAQAATLTSASLSQSTPVPSATSNHTITVSGQTTATTIRCVTVTYNTAADKSGSTPTNLDASSAVWSGSFPTTAFGSWTTANSTAVAKVTLAGGTTPTAGAGRTIVLTGVVNGSVADTTYYAVLESFTDASCTPGNLVDSVVMAYVHTANTVVSVVVDPTLTFTVADEGGANCNGVSQTAGLTASGTAVNLGHVNTGTLPFKAQRLTVSTNAVGGFTVFARYNAAMTDGSHSIADWTGTNASPTATWSAGTEALGYTTSDATLGTGTANRFTNGGAKFAALTGSNAEVSYEATGPISNNQVCVGYQIGVAGSTLAGAYSTTVTYMAVPVF